MIQRGEGHGFYLYFCCFSLTWVHFSVVSNSIGIYNVLKAGSEFVGSVEGRWLQLGGYVGENRSDGGTTAFLQ